MIQLQLEFALLHLEKNLNAYLEQPLALIVLTLQLFHYFCL